jgi:hypothetical protein
MEAGEEDLMLPNRVEERVVNEVAQHLWAPPAGTDEPGQLIWFVTRQPAIVRFLAARLGEDSDAMAVGLHHARAIEHAFARALGVAPPRVVARLLARAEAAFLDEAQARAAGVDAGPGLVERQPALAQLCADAVADPLVPLDEREAARVGLALAAVVYALDEVAFGRPVP